MVELACRKDPAMPAVYGKRGCLPYMGNGDADGLMQSCGSTKSW